MGTMEQIQRELQLLGVSKRYRGYRQAAAAIELALEDEERLCNVTERIYKVIAHRCGCKKSCIERNIRTVSQTAWKMNRPYLRQIAGYPMFASPSASEFISILTAHIQRIQLLRI